MYPAPVDETVATLPDYSETSKDTFERLVRQTVNRIADSLIPEVSRLLENGAVGLSTDIVWNFNVSRDGITFSATPSVATSARVKIVTHFKEEIHVR
jgi:hypothetical protein